MRSLCGRPEISHISDEEIKAIIKSAVSTLHRRSQRDRDRVPCNENLALGRRYTSHSDDPKFESH